MSDYKFPETFSQASEIWHRYEDVNRLRGFVQLNKNSILKQCVNFTGHGASFKAVTYYVVKTNNSGVEVTTKFYDTDLLTTALRK